MIDRREQILARLATLLATLIGGPVAATVKVKTVARNRGLLDNDARPGLVLLDGDEQERTPRVGRNATGRQGMTPIMMAARPQVFVVLDVRQPQNEATGQDLNAIRAAVITAFANDATLKTLVGTNGDLEYNGAETDLKSGSSLDGQARLDFTFAYPLDPF